jgi:DNA-binding MarR family transcriptional regulator
MLVEKCKHTFNESQHFMELTLKGGEFVAWYKWFIKYY